jgi:DNA-binding NarL/FixJ family response regulator
MTKGRILVADDLRGVRKGIENLVGLPFEVVGALDNGKALVETALKLQADALLRVSLCRFLAASTLLGN